MPDNTEDNHTVQTDDTATNNGQQEGNGEAAPPIDHENEAGEYPVDEVGHNEPAAEHILRFLASPPEQEGAHEVAPSIDHEYEAEQEDTHINM
ncbi:hypothetical protein FRC17_003324 [Serendipita sp. 399]|nr:hypothetical protein FRC17_003324 [Serendipita sp. 399]